MQGSTRSPRIRSVAFIATSLTLAMTAQAATLNINPTGSDSGNCQASACQTITYALTQATNGDTLQIAAGTYAEELTINKSVTLQGAGNTATIIQAPATLTSNPAVPGGSAGQKTTIVLVTGASAAMRSLQVLGPGAGNCGSIGHGVFVGGGATLVLDDTRIRLIRDNPISGCQNGTGVRFGATSTAQVGSGQILNSFIDNFQKNGITVSNSGSNVTIRGNTVTGTLASPIAQNGIQVSDGAVAVVDNNTVSDLQCGMPAPTCGLHGDWSTGVLLVSPGSGTQVTNNRVSNADANLAAYQGAGGPYAMTGNQFSNARFVNVWASDLALDLRNNVLSGSAIGLWAANDGTAATDVNLNGGNLITGASQQGILAEAGALNVNVHGSQNQFYGNGSGADNTAAPPAVTMNLSCNWWGAQTGPVNAGNPLGTGNPVTANVTYTNWSINNTDFLCVGNPTRNQQLLQAAQVPTDAPWALLMAALAVGFAGVGALRRRANLG